MVVQQKSGSKISVCRSEGPVCRRHGCGRAVFHGSVVSAMSAVVVLAVYPGICSAAVAVEFEGAGNV